MSNLNIPDQDAEFKNWILQFAKIADLNASQLKLTEEQVVALQEASDAFEDAYLQCKRDQAKAHGSVAMKVEAKAFAEQIFRAYGKAVLYDPDVNVNLKSQLGMKVENRPVSQLSPPHSLSAYGVTGGSISLRWHRNGNSDRTLFIIEARTSQEPNWHFVSTTTKTKFIHKGHPVGIPITYRVKSQRSEKLSQPSNLATVYDVPGSTKIVLNAA